MLLEEPMSGGFVGNCGMLVFVSMPLVLLVSPESLGFLQPWISNTMSTITLKLMEKYTAIFNRMRALFFCSKNAPWGRNGLGLFIALARLASFL